MNKVYRRLFLDQALSEAGIVSKSGAYFWLLARESEGRIVSPRDPVNKQRKYTQAQIEEIVQAFLPSGKGYWPLSLKPLQTSTNQPVA